jgi:hypothetical protein
MYNTKQKLTLLTVVAFSMATTLYSGEVTIPNTFTANSKAKASEVNANFTAIKTAINDNADDIIANKNKLSILENNLTKQASDIESKTKTFTNIAFYKIDSVDAKDNLIENYTLAGYVTIQVPSNGYIHVLATGYIDIPPNTDYDPNVFDTKITIALTTDETPREWNYEYNNTISYKTNFISNNRNHISIPYSIQGVFSVAVGEHDFFIMVSESSSSLPGKGAKLLNNYVTATYFIK